MITSRALHDLLPHVAELAQAFIEKCNDAGVSIIITSTYRDVEAQDALYAQHPKVTNAKGGESFHQYRVAFDFVPLSNGKPVWDDYRLFKRCGEIGESLGLEWAGRFHSFPESCHFQATGGKTIADFKK